MIKTFSALIVGIALVLGFGVGTAAANTPSPAVPALHNVASEAENQQAQNMVWASLGEAGNGGLAGAGIGCVVGAVPGLMLAIVGALVTCPVGAVIGGAIGTAVAGGPALAQSVQDYVGVLNAAPGTTKWAFLNK